MEYLLLIFILFFYLCDLKHKKFYDEETTFHHDVGK
jgi:hypothetical protein